MLVFAPHAGARQVPDSDTDAVHALGTGDVEPALVDAQRDATEILAVDDDDVLALGAVAEHLVDRGRRVPVAENLDAFGLERDLVGFAECAPHQGFARHRPRCKLLGQAEPAVPRGFAVEAGVRRVVIFVDDEAQDQRGEFRDGHAGARLGFVFSAGLWIAKSPAGEPEQRTDFEGLEGPLDLGALLRRFDLRTQIFDIEDVADGPRPGVKNGGAFVAGEDERVSAIFVGRFAADRLGQRRLVGHAHP